ncbi:MAG: anion permease [Megasphaera sp.]|jgi:anion transporter|nr:anion permease [Megasphaera sp.]
MKKKLIYLLLAFFAFVIVGWILPTPEGLPQTGKMALAVGVFAIIVWVTGAVEGAISGIMIVFLLAITKAASVGVAFSGYANSSVWLIVVGFIMAGIMEYVGLSKRIAIHLIGMSKGYSIRIYWAVAVTMAIMTFLVPSITARTLLMLPIILGIGTSFHAEAGKSNIVKALLYIVAMSGTAMSIGVLTAHVGNPITVGMIADATGQSIGWSQWFKIGGPPAFVLGFGLVFLFQFMFPPEINKIDNCSKYVQEELEKLGPISRDEKYTLVVFILTLILWALDSYTNLSVIIVGLFAVIILLLPVFGVMSWKEAQKKVPWNVFVLYGGGLSLGAVLVTSGAAKWIANTCFSPLQVLPLTIQIIALIWIVTIMQVLFTGGGPKTTALTPIIIAYAMSIGADPTIFALLLGMNMQHQYLLPVSNMPNVVICGTDFINSHGLMKTGFIVSVIACAFMSLMTVTYWHWIGLL